MRARVPERERERRRAQREQPPNKPHRRPRNRSKGKAGQGNKSEREGGRGDGVRAVVDKHEIYIYTSYT